MTDKLFMSLKVKVIIIAFFLLLLVPLLMPGYVLTLDMGFAPHILLPSHLPGIFYNGWVVRAFLSFLSQWIPSWIIQKVLFICLFLSMGRIAYKYINVDPSQNKLLVGLFYLINPFVYTRFLAGQWMILFAYALLPLVWHTASLKDDVSRYWWRRSLILSLTLVLVFAFSLHLGVMALCIYLAATVSTISRDHIGDYLRRTLVTTSTFIVGTLYWTIPAFLRQGPSVVNSFDSRHLEAFKTASDPIIGTAGNVLALYGFWGEHEAWAQQFIWPKQYPWLWIVSGGILATLIFLGIYRALRAKELRRQGIMLLVVGVLAFIFSCGVGDTIFKPVNTWLFTHVSFWDGFRDSQKWSALLVLVYAFFIGQFSFANATLKKVGTVLGAGAIVLYTFPMLFGFWGQLRPVWYPAEWYQVNDVLKQDPSCKAIFLPWHGYYSLRFNNNLLTANIARDFFDCDIIQSRQVELGEIATQGPIDPAYDAIEGLVTGKDNLSVDQALSLLRAKNIRYVIFTPDLVGEDSVTYAFLTALRAEKMGDTGVVLYHLP